MTTQTKPVRFEIREVPPPLRLIVVAAIHENGEEWGITLTPDQARAYAADLCKMADRIDAREGRLD